MIDWVWLALRAAGFVLVLQAAGTAIFLHVFRARLMASAEPIRRAGRRLALAALIVCIAQVFLEGAHMAGDWGGLTDPVLLRVAATSSVGRALTVRAVGLVLLGASLWRITPAPGACAFGASLVVIVSFALTGHTTVHAPRLLLATLLIAHLWLVAFWFGALLPLRELARLETGALAAHSISAFSRIAVWLVPLIPLAGAGLALLLLPGPGALWTPYGRLLCLKVMLFALLMVLAALNRQRYAPALERDDRGAAQRFRRSAALEYLLVCATLAATAAMTGFYSPGPDPAASATAQS